MSFVVLDTDVASAVFRGRTSEQLGAVLTGHSLAVTFVTVRHWGPQRLADMRAFLASVIVLPYGERVATTWGEMQARAQLRGRPRPANDAWIAACCLVRRLSLATLNTKDFADFVEHDGLILSPG